MRIASDTEYGLAAGIWTRELARAHRVAAQREAGQVYVNEYIAGDVETPLGGYKLSGYGREKGLEALHPLHAAQMRDGEALTPAGRPRERGDRPPAR